MLILLILSTILFSCQSSEAPQPTATMVSSPPTHVEPIKTATIAILATVPASSPSPSPLSLETNAYERLWFSAATQAPALNSVQVYTNADGTGLEIPALFEPYHSIGSVGRHLTWSPDGRYLAFDGANETYSCNIPETGCLKANYGISIADMENSVIIEHIEATLTNPSWSPDSHYLVISKRNTHQKLAELF